MNYLPLHVGKACNTMFAGLYFSWACIASLLQHSCYTLFVGSAKCLVMVRKQGGSTIFKNFGRRLQHDLQRIVATRQPPGGSPVEVRERYAQMHSCSLLAPKNLKGYQFLPFSTTALQAEQGCSRVMSACMWFTGARGRRAALWSVVWRLRAGHDAAIWQHVLQVHHNLHSLLVV